ncbi:MAG TPA: hypothetical protein PLX49_00680, partial [Prolixibacteraceae bacterium]|nr:hypothetical protein [Prolixibacteraceae bacterium]
MRNSEYCMHAKWLVRLETRFRGQAWVTALLVFIFLGQAGAVGAKTRERLVFDLKLGFVKGGEAILTIRDTTYN